MVLEQDFGNRMASLSDGDVQASLHSRDDGEHRSPRLRLKETGARLWTRLR